MIHYDTFSTEGIKSFGKIFLDVLAALISKYLTFSGNRQNRYNIFRP